MEYLSLQNTVSILNSNEILKRLVQNIPVRAENQF